MVLFFVALPFATLRGEHITVGLIDGAVGPRVSRLLDTLGSLAAAVAVGFVAYHVYHKGLTSVRYNEATMFLRLPLGPFVLLGAGSLALTTLVLLYRAYAGLRGPRTRRDDHAAGGNNA
jgi:TRAP-type C4-dicarboxylate transport system permease small subunit